MVYKFWLNNFNRVLWFCYQDQTRTCSYKDFCRAVYIPTQVPVKKTFLLTSLKWDALFHFFLVHIVTGTIHVLLIFQFMDNGLSGRLGPNVLQLVEMVSKQGHGPVRARPPWTAVTTVNRWAVTRSSKPRSDPSVSETQLVQVGFFYVGIHELFENNFFVFRKWFTK